MSYRATVWVRSSLANYCNHMSPKTQKCVVVCHYQHQIPLFSVAGILETDPQIDGFVLILQHLSITCYFSILASWLAIVACLWLKTRAEKAVVYEETLGKKQGRMQDSLAEVRTEQKSGAAKYSKGCAKPDCGRIRVGCLVHRFTPHVGWMKPTGGNTETAQSSGVAEGITSVVSKIKL